MNPNNIDDLNKLRDAIRHSRAKLRPFRENNVQSIAEYAGTHYGESTTDIPKASLPLLSLAVDIYTWELVAQNPRALVTTPHGQLKPLLSLLEGYWENLAGEIEIEQTAREAVKAAIFSNGIIKVGLERRASVDIEGFTQDVGQPYASLVLLDDWVHDVTAKAWRFVTFAGNRYSLLLEHAQEAEGFERAVREELQATDDSGLSEPGDETTRGIGGRPQPDAVEYPKRVDLWDQWLPNENLFITFELESDKPCLRIRDWDGPEGGMYHRLSFSDVLGNIMPLPPVALWTDLHRLANALFRKLDRQAERQKTIGVVPRHAVQEGQRTLEANDGDLIVGDGEGRQLRLGGPDGGNLAFLLTVKNLFSYAAGNLDLLGGLRAQSGTLGQDELLAASSSKRMQAMQKQTEKFIQGIMRDLLWYGWTDPLIDIPLVKRVPGTDLEIAVAFTPEAREGDFFDYNIKVVPYSMQFESPQARLRKLLDIFAQLVIPGMSLLQEAGGSIEFAELIRLVSRYANLPELNDVIRFADPSLAERRGPIGQPDRGRQSPVTRRENVRINRSAGGGQAQEAGLAQMLVGGQGQEVNPETIARLSQ